MATKTKAAETPPADMVRFVQIDQLIPYARNSRTHSDDQIAKIAASMVEFGFTNPVLADSTGIVAGHGRAMAARKCYAAGKVLRMANGAPIPAGTVPVMDCTGWTETQRRAYVIADNSLALAAGWDQDMLKVEIADLSSAGFDLGLLAFDAGFLDQLTAPEGTDGLTDPDEAPEVPPVPATVPGDVWVMGRHRLICGDSTKADDVARVLQGVKPGLMVTDPPYGVEYDPSWRNEKLGKGNRSTGLVANDDRADWREAWALFPGDVAYVWHGMKTSRDVWESLEVTGFAIRAEIVWAKPHYAISMGDYHPQHESCWYAVRKTGKGHWAGDRKQSTVWQIANNTSGFGRDAKAKKEDAKTGHGTQKPVECMRRPMENNTSPGQAVYEPFSGSGSSIIAAEMSGRCCYAVEIMPGYVDAAVMRWQAFTGLAATHEGSGKTFDELHAERLDDQGRSN